MNPTIHMMTATLARGDAIGNYIVSLARILTRWGIPLRLYSDDPWSSFPLDFRSSVAYRPSGRDILWMHYSLDTAALERLLTSPDVTILDSHGVTPPQLIADYDPQIAARCTRAIELLPALVTASQLTIAHSSYIAAELRAHGALRVRQLPLIVDTARFDGSGDAEWDALLSRLDYLLFVGRVVPQKGLKLAIETFAALHRRRPTVQFFIVGHNHLPRYRAELEVLVQRLKLDDAVIFTGPVDEATILASFYRHARFYYCMSEWESFCVPIVEALHHSTPVLGRDRTPIPETMGQAGVVLRGNADAMAAQIDALWDDKARYQLLQAAAVEHAGSFTDAALETALRALLAELPDLL